MTNVCQFPTQIDRRLEKAGDWIAAVERGITEEEEQELGAWLAEDKANHAAFMEYATLWDEMDALARLSDLFPEPRTKRRFPPNRTIFATAASFLVALTFFAVFDNTDVGSPENQETLVVADEIAYETQVGEQASYELSDGTTLLLNTNSLVRVGFTESNRLLSLERGEIHVTVAHDPTRRLSVLVGEKVVQAVGTEFNLEITPDQSIELVVTEGVVLVGVLDESIGEFSPDAPIILTQSSTLVGAGNEAVINAQQVADDEVEAERIEGDDIAVRLSWREGNLIFRGESLEEAVFEVGRYTAVEFIFSDEEAKQVRVAGLFKAGDVNGLLAALRNHFNIAYEWQGDSTIFLSSD